MKMKTAVRIRECIEDACRAVEAAFPLPGYLDRVWQEEITHVAAAILKKHPITETRPLLMDIGCGPTDKTAVFQALGFDCWALDDLGDPWLERLCATDKVLEFAAKMGIHLRIGGFEDTKGIPRGCFDVVTLLDVVEHLHESPRELLNTAGDLLRPGGLLCVSMPNSVNLRKRLAVFAGRTNYPSISQLFYTSGVWRGHVREYTLDEVRWICTAAGFEVLSASTFEAIAYSRLPRWIVPFVLVFEACMPTLRSGLCVIARKPPDWVKALEAPDKYREAVRDAVPPGIR